MRKGILLLLILILNLQKSYSQEDHVLNHSQPLKFTSIGTGTYNRSVIYNDLTKGLYIDLARVSDNISSNPIDFKINARGGINHFFTIKGENGNVGIGTNTPKASLHIFGQTNGGFNGLVIDNRKNYGVGSGINQTSRILLSLSENGASNPLSRIFGVIESGTLSETDSSNGRLSFHVRQGGSVSEKMRISHNGNVGIGTNSPKEKFQIGSTYTFHDGGHKVIGLMYAAGSGGVDLSTSKYAAEVRFNPDSGLLGFGTSTALNNAPTPRLNIDKKGYVGIGTNSPKEKFQIGSTYTFHDGGHKVIGLMYAAGSGGVDLSTSKYAAEVRFNPDSGLLGFGTSTALNNAPTPRLNIDKKGYVGIGTNSPKEKFQIGSTYTFHDGGHKVIGFMYAASGGVDLSTSKYAAEVRFDPDLGILRFGTSSAIDNTPTARLNINKNGYVGIGVSDTKGFRLGVKGRIAAEEVKVAVYNNWPDFVFKEEYNLPTLNEVEKYIKEKGHLVNIPSAEEVKKEGLFLGEMNAKLLQKIEELTLYTIEQQKELEQQKEKTIQQQKELQNQTAINKSLGERLQKIETLLESKK